MLTLSSAFPTTSVLPKVCKWDVITLEKEKKYRGLKPIGKKWLFAISAVIWIRTQKGS